MEKKKKVYKAWPVVKRLLGELLSEQPKLVGLTTCYTLFAVCAPLLSIALPKLAIGILEKGKETAAEDLVKAMVAYFVVATIILMGQNISNFKIQIVNMRSRVLNMCKMYAKLMRMDYCYVEDASFWEENERAISGAFNNNTEGMEGVLNKIYLLPAKVLILIALIVVCALLSPLVAVALIVHALVIVWISREDHNFRYARKEEAAKIERKISYYQKTSQDFAFGKDIRIFNLRDRILKNYHEEVKACILLFKKFENHKYWISMLGVLTLLVSNVLMYGTLIRRAMNGMPISSFTMYVTLIDTLLATLIDFGNDLAFIQNQSQYLGDAFTLIDSDITTDKKEKIVIPEGEQIEIVFDHVDFKYPGSETYVYKDLNFTIHKGERLAIVGVNGAGKTTLVKLMLGLFSPTAGHVYINGHDVNNFNKKDLYDIYSAVFQDVNILAFPIRENVVGSSKEVDDAKVEKALESVGLWEKVQGFSKGLDQMMLKVIDEEGTDFSGGERQKLSIARGLYKDAPMVVMDEPTAALDALAEAAIYESFSDMVQGKTAVYISHRLASTKFCDKIALFDKTGLIEYGTHEELMEKKGEYYRMFVIQGKYYQMDDDDDDDDMKRIFKDQMSGEEGLV